MATNKHPSRKKRLIKLAGQTKWAPFWTVFKIYGKDPGDEEILTHNWGK